MTITVFILFDSFTRFTHQAAGHIPASKSTATDPTSKQQQIRSRGDVSE